MLVPTRHLYVHVPFCARRCSYCDFSIAVRSATPIDEYVNALRKELATQSTGLEASPLETVYLGGGTPSRLGGPGVGNVLNAVLENPTIAPAAEITIEANPHALNDAAVAHWIAAGVKRVSFGEHS